MTAADRGRTSATPAVAAGLAWRAAPGALTLLAVCTVAAAAVPVGSALAVKLLLDRITAGDTAVIGPGLGLCVLGLALAALPALSSYLRSELARATGLTATDRLYSALNRLPGLARFEDPAFVDRLRMATQSSGTPVQVVDGALGLGGSLLTVGGFLTTLLAISPVMAAVITAGAVPALLAELALARRTAAMLWQIGPAQRREFFYADLMANIEAAKEVRLFGLGGFFRARMLAERRQANDRQRRLDRRNMLVQVSLGVLSAAITGGGIIWVVSGVRAGTISVGDVAMFVAAAAGVQAGNAALVNQIASTHRQLLLFRHFRDVEATRSDLPLRPHPVTLAPLRSGIEFRDVWFRYSPSHPWVLRGVNLTIPYGQTVGLVGHNGSGKSTLVKLLCRFYDPQRGSVRWDGVDLRDLDPAELRNRISALFQDFMTYDLSAGENVGLGDLRLLQDEPSVRRAARGAGIHDDLMSLPKGYDTLLTRVFFDTDADDEATGVVLSGGQWQRVALARAILRGERDLLIMDEPSASLDPEAEFDIHRRVKAHRAGRTSLLISHRLGGLRDADQLAVLADGCVAELGRHDELMARDGLYARLFTMQADGYRSDLNPEVRA
ncbi:ABC transporter ATP-binding protein [Micromonospora sp. NPDC007230]|uniref:ABC transporter ATP-binding protein n=1 Tax=Micromonospora sp. NPDC007230 TaxID=3364237 RepID=UPI0036B3783B